MVDDRSVVALVEDIYADVLEFHPVGSGPSAAINRKFFIGDGLSKLRGYHCDRVEI